MDKVRHGGFSAIGLGGTSSCLKVEEVCRARETEACKAVRLKEVGNFSGGVVGGTAGGFIASLAVPSVCAVFAIGTAGVGAPVCGIALIGAGSLAGGLAGGDVGEMLGEKIYESIAD
jgi:hypothetical protein